MAYVDCVQVAKEIRKELKAAFPSVKFSVRSDRYSMGSSVDISWDNLPSRKAVEAITEKYSNVRRCEATGETLSGGNMFVFANQNITKEFRAEVESNMSDDEKADHFRYARRFNDIVDEMYAEQYGVAEAKQETIETVNDESNNAALRINEEKQGIEIQFKNKPSHNVIEALKEMGFRWTSYAGGYWWAKNTPERYKVAQMLVESYNSIILEEPETEAPEAEQTEIQTVPTHSNVISLMDHRKAVKMAAKLTAEQQLKLFTLNSIMGKEECSKMLQSMDIDSLFKRIAEMAEAAQALVTH